jgi:hypothetical protein
MGVPITAAAQQQQQHKRISSFHRQRVFPRQCLQFGEPAVVVAAAAAATGGDACDVSVHV